MGVINFGRNVAWSASASKVNRVWKAAINPMSTDKPGESPISSNSRS